MKVFTGVLLLGLALVAAVRADVGFGPHPSRPIGIPAANAVPVIIQADETAREPRLIVPRSLVRSAKLAKSAAAAPGGRAGLPLPLAVALSLSFAVVGLGLVCGRRMTRSLFLTLALVAVGGATLWAHPPPPPQPPLKPFPDGLPIDGVAVEFADQGDRVRLVLPKAMTADMAKKLKERMW
jgi:hypothetical protein